MSKTRNAFTMPFDMYANLGRIKSDPFPACIGIGKQYTGAFEERLCNACQQPFPWRPRHADRRQA